MAKTRKQRGRGFGSKLESAAKTIKAAFTRKQNTPKTLEGLMSKFNALNRQLAEKEKMVMNTLGRAAKMNEWTAEHQRVLDMAAAQAKFNKENAARRQAATKALYDRIQALKK